VSAGVVHRFRAMGCDAVVAGEDPAAVAAVLERWEETFSLFRPESELSRVNRSPARVVAVSRLFASTLETALDAAAETEGLVDPTLCGRWSEIVLSGRLLSRPPGRELDLNGVVKSLAVDEAVATLDGPGFVSVGGDLAVRGPVDVALPAGGAIRVVSGGLATSGTATRGQHLLDPATGRASKSPWEQVTASGATCLGADVAAKVGFLLGERGPEWLDERGVPGRFLGVDGEIVENDAWAGATRAVQPCT
jgi:thiamine biosynthesis lipoprotein